MTITLNHTIVPAIDNRQAARFFATIMGLQESPPSGRTGNFVPVRVNEQLTLDFMTVAEPWGCTWPSMWTRPRSMPSWRVCVTTVFRTAMTPPIPTTDASTTRCALAACSSSTPLAICTR